MTTSTIERVGQLRGLGDYLLEAGLLVPIKSILECSPGLLPEMRQAGPESHELTGAVIEHHLIALATRAVVVPAIRWTEHVAAEQDRKEIRNRKARWRRVLQKIERERQAKRRRNRTN
jgi:hypothetical protein